MHPVARTFGLFALLTMLFVAVGYIIGAIYGDTIFSLAVFLLFAIVINFVSYFFSSKIVLWSYRARIVDESEAPMLHTIVGRLASRAGLPKPRVAIAPIANPNAFATGRNPKNAVVCVTEGLLGLLNEKEMEAVLGHELGHVKHRDILLMTVAATIAGLFSMGARIFFWNSIFSRDRDENFLIYVLLALAAFAALLIQLAISRQREYHADEFSVRLTRHPEDLISDLIKLERGVYRKPIDRGNPSTASLFIVNPFRGQGLVALFSTHPPTEKRIAHLREIERELKYE